MGFVEVERGRASMSRKLPKLPRFPVIGRLTPYPTALILGTGFSIFDCTNWNGLARVDGERIDILAISTAPVGAGYCRKFFGQLKDAYMTIKVYAIENEILREALLRWGFTPFKEADILMPGQEEAWIEGLQWTRRQ